MLSVFQGGFHVDLHSEIRDRILPLLENEKRVFLVVPEMETLIAEEEAMREYPAYSPRFFEVTNFSRLANSVFRLVGGLTDDPYDKTAKALLMWRALSEAMPSLSTSTRNDISVGLIERSLKAVSEMRQLDLDREALARVCEDDEVSKNARLSDKLRDLCTTMEIYGNLLSEDGKITSELSRMEEKLKGAPELFFDTHFFFEGFTSFTEEQINILKLLISRANVTVALRLPKHLSDAFEYTETRNTLARLVSLSASVGVECQRRIFDTNRMVRSESLATISKFLWTQNIKFDNDCLQNLGNSLRIFSARTPYEEASFIANDIARRVREEGARYSDFAIVARDISLYNRSLDSALREGGIPAFVSNERTVLSFEGVKVIDLAYRTVASGFSRADVVAYAKCGLVGLTREETDTFEMYVDRWGIHGRAFLEEGAFTMNPDGYTNRENASSENILSTVQKARETLIEPLVRLSEDANKKQSVHSHARALVDFLLSLSLPVRLDEQAEHLTTLGEDALATEVRKLWRTIVGVLDKVVETLDGFEVDMRSFSSLLNIAFSSVKVGRLPESQDEVTLGSANTLRLYNKKHIYLIGVNYGEFPANVSDGSYFTERERETLRSLGLSTEPSSDVRFAKEQFFFTRAFLSASDTVTLITTQKNASFKNTPPSPVLDHLEEASGGRLRAVPVETLPLLSRAETVRGAIDALTQASDEERDAILDALQTSGEDEAMRLSRMPIYNASLSLSGELAREVFPEQLALTQSRLESFVNCPLQHFLRYVLALSENREAKLDALSIGNLVHGILESFFAEVKRSGEPYENYDTERIRTEVERIGDAYLRKIGFFSDITPAKRIHSAKRICESAIAVVESLMDELRASKYLPAFFELKIEKNNPNSPTPHTVTGEDGEEIYIYGTIDRVDTYVKDDTAFVRVIDYKTGSKTFSRDDLAEGKNLQMFLYLASILESTNFRTRLGVSANGEVVGGGVVYVQTALDAKATPTPDFDPMAVLGSNQKRSGMVLWEEDSIGAMHPEYLPITLTKNGGVHAASLSRTYSRAEWGDIMATVDDSVRRVTSGMRGGDISASPLKGKSADNCKYCPFRPVCRKISE